MVGALTVSSASMRASPYVCSICIGKQSALPRTGLGFQSPAWRQQSRGVGRNYLRRMILAEEQFNERAQDIRDGRKKSVLQLLEERGFINQIVGNRDELDNLLTNRRVGVYAGVDPTAPSLHVGHMVPFMALSWLFVHGYPVHFLLGGATAMIGDPTGRLTARAVQNRKDRKANIAAMHMQLKRFGEMMEKYAGRRGFEREWAWRRTLDNNSIWHGKTPVTEWLRLMLAGVRLGPMLGRDSVKNRMEKGDGMSLAEFCYPLVQAWDWWYLFQRGVQVQIGGADQFGNILQGAEAVKYTASVDVPWLEKMEQEQIVVGVKKKEHEKSGSDIIPTCTIPVTEDPVGFTVPLLTTASGEKFGKSAGNAVWLDPDMTPPFELYQFFLRSSDEDVEKYLKLLTFLSLGDIKALMEEHAKDPSKRVAQHKLASEFVELIHGLGVAQMAEKQHRSVFNKNTTLGDILNSSTTASTPAGTTGPAGTGTPPPHPRTTPNSPAQTAAAHGSNTCILPRSMVHNQHLSRVLYAAGLVSSRTEGGQLILKGGAYIGSTSDGKRQMSDSLSYTPVDRQVAQWRNYESFLIRDENAGDSEDNEQGEEVLILRSGKWRVKIIRIISDEEFIKRGLTTPGWDHALGKPLDPEEALDPKILKARARAAAKPKPKSQTASEQEQQQQQQQQQQQTESNSASS